MFDLSIYSFNLIRFKFIRIEGLCAAILFVFLKRKTLALFNIQKWHTRKNKTKSNDFLTIKLKVQKLDYFTEDRGEGGSYEEGDGYSGSGVETARGIRGGVPVAAVTLLVTVTVPAAVPQQEVRQPPEQVSARVQALDRVVLIHVHLQKSTQNICLGHSNLREVLTRGNSTHEVTSW